MPATGHENVSTAQFELLDDLDVVRQFGERHPDAFVTVWFENAPTVRLVALLSGDDLAEHESELRKAVTYPDRLEVRRSKWSKSDRKDVARRSRSARPMPLPAWATGGAYSECSCGPTRRTGQRRSAGASAKP